MLDLFWVTWLIAWDTLLVCAVGPVDWNGDCRSWQAPERLPGPGTTVTELMRGELATRSLALGTHPVSVTSPPSRVLWASIT